MSLKSLYSHDYFIIKSYIFYNGALVFIFKVSFYGAFLSLGTLLLNYSSFFLFFLVFRSLFVFNGIKNTLPLLEQIYHLPFRLFFNIELLRMNILIYSPDVLTFSKLVVFFIGISPSSIWKMKENISSVSKHFS